MVYTRDKCFHMPICTYKNRTERRSTPSYCPDRLYGTRVLHCPRLDCGNSFLLPQHSRQESFYQVELLETLIPTTTNGTFFRSEWCSSFPCTLHLLLSFCNLDKSNVHTLRFVKYLIRCALCSFCRFQYCYQKFVDRAQCGTRELEEQVAFAWDSNCAGIILLIFRCFLYLFIYLFIYYF